MAGYGMYWYCLELIARGVEKNRLTFELEHDAELIAADTGMSRELVEDMMRFMVDAGLFENAGGVITCLKMASRTDEYTAKLLTSVNKYRVNLPIVSGQTPDSVGKKSVLLEEKRTEEKRSSRFAPPTPAQVAEYAQSIGAVIDADRFVDFYASKGWKVGKSPMKDWQACVRTWKKSADPSPASPFGVVL